MRLFSTLILAIFVSFSFSQTLNVQDNLKGWYLKDKTYDHYMGISLNKAYQFLYGKKSTPVIVAIIDSGVDTTHEDLKSVLWTNPKEIPGNGKDDDGNGYVDDVHGWNFLGGRNGTEVENASAEKARVYHGFKNLYLNKEIDTNTLSKADLYQYKMWQRAAREIEPSPETLSQVYIMERIAKKIIESDSLVMKETNTKEYNTNELEKLTLKTEAGKRAKLDLLNLMKALPFGTEAKNTFIIQSMNDELGRMQGEIDAKEKVPEDVHATIIKDNYSDFNDRYYGNTDIMGKGSLHGTHVSGIIGAVRNNNIGMDGIADNVQIMMIRAVPDGDEYDKDIALAIIYAVDNGAKVINMSFGKSFSPQKKWVDEAIKYAASKDVLLIHAAGNDGRNIDSTENYPCTQFLDGSYADNVITVGASADTSILNNYAAGFSNYGKKMVNVFAPGSQIYSCFPGGNKYGFLDGTSMASPVVAGLAALVRSYYPTLSAVQTKMVIEQSVTQLDSTYTLFYPGTSDTIAKMSNLCSSGGIVNAYGAVTRAEEMILINKNKIHRKKGKAATAPTAPTAEY